MANGARSNLVRSPAVDAVRIVGVVAIVLGHTIESTDVRALTYTWHVPIFFFLSGYLWKSGRSINSEFWRRAETLLVPYVAWLAVIAVPLVAYLLARSQTEDAAHRTATVILGGQFLKSPFQAFWFVTALFFACLFYRVIEWKLRAVPLWVIAASLLGLGVLAGDILKMAPESIGVAIPATGFLLFGRISNGVAKKRFAWPAGLLAIVVVAVATLAGWNVPLDLKDGDFGRPVVSVACSVAVCFGLVALAERFLEHPPISVQRAILRVGPLGFGVVLAHGIPIFLLNGQLSGGSTFLASLVFGYAIAAAIGATKLRGWLLGGDLALQQRFRRAGRAKAQDSAD